MDNDPKTPEYLKDTVFVAFDTETTGLWATTNRLIEIGAVKFKIGSGEAETFQSLINPLQPIPLDAFGVHGISDDMVADADPANIVLGRFLEFCQGADFLAAHNAPFDISFVGSEIVRSGLILPEFPILDTVEISRKVFPGLPSYSLESLIRFFRIDNTQAHRALSDALQVKQLIELSIPYFLKFESIEEFSSKFIIRRMANWKPDEIELPDRYSDIMTAIEKSIPLEIEYAGQGRPVETRTIKPIRVEARGDQIYLTAFCEKAKAERTFRLDRIVSFYLVEPD